MYYDFKKVPELFWVLLQAAAVGIAIFLLDFDANNVNDWTVFAKALLGAAIRPVMGAILAMRSHNEQPEVHDR